jgi:hypothetical protein
VVGWRRSPRVPVATFLRARIVLIEMVRVVCLVVRDDAPKTLRVDETNG